MAAFRSHHAGFVALLFSSACAFSALSGCAGSRTSATASRVTTPTAPPLEPRSATGQGLEDLFFPYAAGMERFDMDAALDEGGGGYEYYDETAAGEYYDETAAGEVSDEAARQELQLSELRELHERLTQLEQALTAEGHPLSASLGELRGGVALVLESPADFPEVATLLDVGMLISQDFFDSVEHHVQTTDPRPRDATDCSLGAIALYGATYDTLVQVQVEAHMSLSEYMSEQDLFRSEQDSHLSAATAIVEWLDAHPTLPAEPWGELDRLFDLSNDLYDIESYLTPDTDQAVSAAFDQLAAAEDAEDIRAALGGVRTAVSATLANVPSPPFEAEVRAYEEIPAQLRRALEQLPSPGPRAALRLIGRRGLHTSYELVDFIPEPLETTARWARVACEGAPTN
ncbi:MAG: hypothetical protein H6725_00815 [Sandaracinaceae bacterium]|nr:hypothetical protein [Sandaracinaceae bacterium]